MSFVDLVAQTEAFERLNASDQDVNDAAAASCMLEGIRHAIEQRRNSDGASDPAGEMTLERAAELGYYRPPDVLPHEACRLAALRSYADLERDTRDTHNPCHDITELVSSLLGFPIALVSLVEDKRQWFKARTGLGASETSRCVSFCAHAIHNPRDVFVVEDATKDIRFAGNPLVTGPPHIRCYVGASLVNSEGYALGTLCVIDSKPRKVTEHMLHVMRRFARVTMSQLELHRTLHRRTIERNLSEWLLQVVMPEQVAKRLKSQPRELIADRHPGVTVLFVDIVGFASFASGIDPEQLVKILSCLFKLWDRLVMRHHLCKIKSIGDAFLVCGGLSYEDELITTNMSPPCEDAEDAEDDEHLRPEPPTSPTVQRTRSLPPDAPCLVASAAERRRLGATRCLAFARDLVRSLHYFNASMSQQFAVRVGAHTGDVVAGVLGTRQIAFDVFGDTVNVASRLEHQANANSVLVSSDTHKEASSCCDGARVERKTMALKGIGAMDTYELRYALEDDEQLDTELRAMIEEFSCNQARAPAPLARVRRNSDPTT